MCRAKELCCFNCTNWFDKDAAKSCRTCGDWKCSRCGNCLCDLTLREKKIAIAYMATYENLLKQLTGDSYDFSRHRRILRELEVDPKVVIGGIVHR